MTTPLRRRLAGLATALWTALAALPATAAPLTAPSDNNLHIDRGVVYTNEPFLSASGGTAPYRFTITGTLPSGISMSSDGLLSGVTCGSNGGFPLGTTTVTDAAGASSSSTRLTLIVNAAPAGGCSLTVSTTLATPVVGQPYSGTITVSGGTAPYTFSVVSGTLPEGLTLSGSGTLSGTPTNTSTTTFTVMAVDRDGATGSQTFTVTASSGAALTLSPASLASGTVGVAYNQSFGASGGSAPYSYAVTAGALPGGLTLAAGGTLSGTPTAAGSFAFTVTASGGGSSSGSRSYSLTIGAALAATPAVASTTLTAGSPATPFTPVTASGGSGSYAFSVAPAMPAGLSMDASGQISGTPGAALATTTYTVTVSDGHGTSASASFQLVVNVAGSLALTPTTLPAAQAGSAYAQTLTVSGGAAPYTFAVTAGSLPAGLVLSTSGELSGTPTSAGSVSFTIGVGDPQGHTGARSYTLAVSAALAAAVQVPQGSITLHATATRFTPVLASGGSGPYVYSVAPNLPAGLVLDAASGEISGTPTQASAMTTYTVQVTDAQGTRLTREFALAVSLAPALDVQPRSVSLPGIGLDVDLLLVASGGTAPYQFAVVAGTLPGGLVLAADGRLSGRAQAAGLASVTLRISDASGTSTDIVVTFSVGARPDLRQDRTLAALQAAQAEALQRLAGAQLRHVLQRLDDDGDCRAALDARLRLGTLALAESSGGCTRGWSAWLAGGLERGRQGDTATRRASRFGTPGLTLGLDTSPAAGWRAGLALGHGQDASELGSDDSRVDARAASVTAYAGWQAAPGWRLSAAAGHARTRVEQRRTLDSDGSVLAGRREVQQYYAALGASLPLHWQGWRLTPRSSLQWQRARLGAFEEDGAHPLRVAYASARLRSVEARAGAALSHRLSLAGWSVEPALALDWHHRGQGDLSQAVRYADEAADTAVVLRTAPVSQRHARADASLRLQHRSGAIATVGVSTTLGGDALSARRWQAALRWTF